jgi:hypothetical protein
MALRKARVKTPRQVLSQALSKSLAYYTVGKHADAKKWANVLVAQLRSMGLLDPVGVDRS